MWVPATARVYQAVGVTAALLVAGGGVAALEKNHHHPADGHRLRKVLAVFRHGSRTPLHGTDVAGFEDCVWDGCVHPERNWGAEAVLVDRDGRPLQGGSKVDARQSAARLPGSCHKGQLTNIGANQALELGRRLHREYGSFLATEQPKLYYRSTNVMRCVLTLRHVLRTLHPDSTTPVTIHTTDNGKEYMTPSHSCARMRELFEEAYETLTNAPTKEAVAVRSALRAVLPNEVYAKLKIDSTFIHVRDVVVAMHSNGKDLPYAIPPALLERLDRLGGMELAALLHHDAPAKTEAARLGIGRLLSEITDTLMDEGPSFSLYSGHDSTLEPLLIALGIFDGRWPDYCSALVFEEWEGPKGVDGMIRITYQGDQVFAGSLDCFRKFVADKIPVDFDKECAPQKKSSDSSRLELH